MSARNAFYAQSGGVTAVINATACGVIETARKHRNKISNVYAGRNGIIGALTEDMIDTNRESAKTIAALRHTPGGAFGSARYKLKSLEENKAEYERLIEVFRAHDIGYFFYNGGNDSMDTAHKVSLISKRMGYPVTCLGIPKTVDNDLPITDNCPGFGSVAKYVAVSTKEAALDVLSMAKTSTKVFVLEVMGRHAGWIAAAGGLAGNGPDEPPHIILFPEIPFNKRAFLKRVRECVRKYDYCVIVVSEGASIRERQVPGRGRYTRCLRTRATRRRCSCRRADGSRQPGIQVPLRGCRLPAALRQAYRLKNRCRAGLCRGQSSRAIRATGQNSRHAGHQARLGQAIPLEDRIGPIVSYREQRKDAAATLHHQRRIRYHPGGRRYLEPLIRGEDYPPYINGLPSYVSLKNAAVKPLLKRKFVV